MNAEETERLRQGGCPGGVLAQYVHFTRATITIMTQANGWAVSPMPEQEQ